MVPLGREDGPNDGAPTQPARGPPARVAWAVMNSDKRDGHLLDELLGIDPHAFEDDERTQVYQSDPPPADDSDSSLEVAVPKAPPAPRRVAVEPAGGSAPAEDEAPTGVPPGVAAAPPAPSAPSARPP